MARNADQPRLVSVVLPTRNRASTLETAIRSVLSGTYDEVELVVVDDASDDDTSDLVESISDERVSYTMLAERVGAARARNIALEQARGELVAFQDSDDAWTEDHLELLAPAVEQVPSPVAVAYGLVEYGSGMVVPGEFDLVRSGDLRAVLARYNIIGLPAVVVRRDTVRSLPAFDPSLRRLEDWDLFLNLATDYRFAFVERVVVHAGEGSDRITTDQAAYYAALERILDRHSNLFSRVPEYEVSYRMQLLRNEVRRKRVRGVVRHGVAAGKKPAGLARWTMSRILNGVSPVDRRPAQRGSRSRV